jgi:hypothetical protein
MLTAGRRGMRAADMLTCQPALPPEQRRISRIDVLTRAGFSRTKAARGRRRMRQVARGFQTRSNPTFAKSLTFAVANSVTP